jgi:Domain of unknown function (DUF2431)
VLHSVDACQLDPEKVPEALAQAMPFHHVIFHHPHIGEESLQKHRALLGHFFHAVTRPGVLHAQGVVHVSLGGTQPQDWRLADQAQRHGLSAVLETVRLHFNSCACRCLLCGVQHVQQGTRSNQFTIDRQSPGAGVYLQLITQLVDVCRRFRRRRCGCTAMRRSGTRAAGRLRAADWPAPTSPSRGLLAKTHARVLDPHTHAPVVQVRVMLRALQSQMIQRPASGAQMKAQASAQVQDAPDCSLTQLCKTGSGRRGCGTPLSVSARAPGLHKKAGTRGPARTVAGP